MITGNRILGSWERETVLIVQFIVLINFILLPNAIMTISLFLFIFTCIFLSYDKTIFYRDFTDNILLYISFTGYYIFNVLSILWSQNWEKGFDNLQSSLILLFLPFAIIFFKQNISRRIHLYYVSFVIGLFLFCLGFYHHIILGYSFGVPEYLYLRDSNLFIQIAFIIHNDLGSIYDTANWGLYEVNRTSFFFIHQVYFSAILVIGSIVCGWLLIQLRHRAKYILIVPLLIFTYTVLEYRSFINKALIFLIPICIIIFQLIKNLNLKKSKSYLLFTLGLTSLVLFFCFQEFLLNYIFMVTKDEERKIIYECAKNVYLKGNYLFGAGIGDTQALLDACFQPFKSNTIFAADTYNTHSGFLHFLLSGGILNLGLYIFFFVFITIESLKRNNLLLFLITITIIANNLTENFSSRVLGAYTTIIFILLAYFNSQEEKKIKNY